MSFTSQAASLFCLPEISDGLSVALEERSARQNLRMGGILLGLILIWGCGRLIADAWAVAPGPPAHSTVWSQYADYALLAYSLAALLVGAALWPTGPKQTTQRARSLVAVCSTAFVVWAAVVSAIEFNEYPFAFIFFLSATAVLLTLRTRTIHALGILILGLTAFAVTAKCCNHSLSLVISQNRSLAPLLLTVFVLSRALDVQWAKEVLEAQKTVLPKTEEAVRTPQTIGSTAALELHVETLDDNLESYLHHLLLMLRCSPDIYATVTKEGRISFLNRPVEELSIGGSITDGTMIMLGKRAGESMVRAVGQVLEDGVPIVLESKAANGTYWQIRLVPVSEEGSVEEVMVIATNRTEQRKAEQRENALAEKLEQAERIDSLVSLAGGVAHELNNILGPVTAMPSLIMMDLAPLKKEHPELISSLDSDLRQLRESAKTAGNIIRDLLTVGRQGHTIFQPMDLNGVVEDALMAEDIARLCEQYPDVDLKTTLTNESITVKGAHSHLVRVLANIIQNSFEATAPKGAIHISTSVLEVSAAKVLHYAFLPPGQYARVEIRDTGTGVDAELLPKVFEPFVTTKPLPASNSRGLGLTIAHSVVKDHDGYIDIESTPGEGTLVSVYLHAMPQLVAPHPTERDIVRGRDERILIVEDDLSQRNIMERALRTFGYDVTLTAGGAEAIKLFGEALDKNRKFDLVLLDLVMEPELDGLDVLRQLRKLQPEQKAVIVSGFLDPARMEEAQELGAGWLAKPYVLEELANEINRTLHSA